MARVGGKRAGRVSILVIPDATEFRNRLKLMLKRVEQSMSANLQVTADTSSAESTLRKLKRDWDGRKVDLAAGMSTAAATAQLRVLTRPRAVPVFVRVSKASLTKAATAIAAVTGGRLIGDLIQNVGDKLANLDRALPKIALVANGVGSIGALALSSVGGLFTLGTGLLQVFGVAAALPGILGGIAVGGTVLALALSDTKNQLADLAPDFANLKSIVIDNFWAGAAQPIRDFVGSVLPSLQTGLNNSSSAIGGWATSIVQSFQTALGGGVIDAMFENLVRSIEIASTGTGGFAQAIVTLAAVGGANLPRLAQWVADLSNRFNDFITRVEADGSLQRFIDSGVTAAQQLGDALWAIGSIFSGITDAANAAGGGGLATFASILGQVAEAVNSPAFQSTLTQFFEGAAGGAAGLATALAPIGAMLAYLAPTISTILSSSGEVVGKILGSIADALASPAFQVGLESFFDGLQQGLLAVAPSLPAIAAALGAFLSIAGKLAAVLGPVLGAALSILAPILVEILQAVEPLLPQLGDAFLRALEVLAPQVVELVEALLPLLDPLTTLLVTLLTPTNIQSVSNLAMVVGFLAGILGGSLDLLNGYANSMNDIVQVFLSAPAVLNDFVASLLNTPGPLRDALQGVVDFSLGIVNSFVDGLNGIGGAVQGFINWVSDALNLGATISLPKLPRLSWDLSKFPGAAAGADVWPTPGGTPVVLGEGGRKETVTDYGRTNRLISLASSLAERAVSAPGGSGDQYFDVHPPAGEDPRVTARAWAREFGRQGG